MARFIVKLHDHYFEYSTVNDAPATFGMTLDEFKTYYRDEYGQQGIDGLPKRLERVSKYGTSNVDGRTPFEVLWLNRAGEDEVELGVDEIYRAYCLREPIRDGWSPK